MNRYFPNAPVEKRYVLPPERIAADDHALAPLVKRGVADALSLPKPR